MTIEQILVERFRELSPEKQQELLDFAEFLLQPIESSASRPGIDWRSSCIGMWRERDDIKDSSSWVRQLRQQEWGS